MPEIILHYIWQQHLWLGFEQTTTDGQPIEIISVGEHNLGSGPDFTHVRVRIGDKVYEGAAEMHVTSADWYRHHHHTNPVYDTVVLHVVRRADRRVCDSAGRDIPQCELQYDDDRDYLQSLLVEAQRMDKLQGVMRCYQHLLNTPLLLSEGWRSLLLQHRLDCKQASILKLLKHTQGDWEQAFYITLMRNFGFHTNGDAMERTAMATPLLYLRRHRNSLFQLTAILLGQSGLLREDTVDNNELQALWLEYNFLRHKFGLTPIDHRLWKTARLRPANAPMVRLRQVAQLLYEHEFVFSHAMSAFTPDALRRPFTLHPDAVDEQSRVLPPAPIGDGSIDILLINTVIPYKYAYSHYLGEEREADEVIALMEQLPPEQNNIIRQWQLMRQQVHSAADTQALIHLYQHFCQSHDCINCSVASQVFLSPSGQLRLF